MDEVSKSRIKHDYDIPTAVTFLIAGLGIGSVLTVLFSSHFERALRTAHKIRQGAPHLQTSPLRNSDL
jgi:hypothetical protein